MSGASDLFGGTLVLPTLSLWEPWASLIAEGLKHHETRHWPTKRRGLMAVHASKKVDVAGAPHALCEFAWGEGWAKTRPGGHIVAVAELTGCFPSEVLEGSIWNSDWRAGNFGPGRYGFRLENVRPLLVPIPAKGAQGWWRWQAPANLDDLLAPAVDQAAAAQRWADAA